MNRLSDAQQAAALEAMYKMTYFGQEECVAMLECLRQKVSGSYLKGEWSDMAGNIIDDLITDLKHDLQVEQSHEELDAPVTLGNDQLGRTYFPGLSVQLGALTIRR
jgi:hypothetical protein